MTFMSNYEKFKIIIQDYLFTLANDFKHITQLAVLLLNPPSHVASGGPFGPGAHSTKQLRKFLVLRFSSKNIQSKILLTKQD